MVKETEKTKSRIFTKLRTDLKTVITLVSAIGISLLAGGVGSAFTIKNIPTWYAGLNKPFFSPPNWLFAPVWTTLYIMMGISLFLITQRQKPLISKPVKIYLLHLIVNSLWSIVFFGMRSPGLAYIVIVILWYMIFRLIGIFSKIDKRASYLLIPYLAWVSFASFLNLSVWYLNK